MIKYMVLEIKLTDINNSKMINILVSLNWDTVRAMVTTSLSMDNKFMVNGKKISASLINTSRSANILRN